MKTEKEYERLTKTEATKGQMMEYGWAIKELAEGLSAHSVWDMFRHVEAAQRYLAEFKGNFTKTPELNEKEAEIASGLHTYMRKGMDSSLSCILYRMISETVVCLFGTLSSKVSWPIRIVIKLPFVRLTHSTTWTRPPTTY